MNGIPSQRESRGDRHDSVVTGFFHFHSNRRTSPLISVIARIETTMRENVVSKKKALVYKQKYRTQPFVVERHGTLY